MKTASEITPHFIRPTYYQYRDVTTGANGATEVAPKFSDVLTLSQPRGADSTTIAEVAAKKIPWLRP